MAPRLLALRRMATHKSPDLDFVTLASLHAALDSVLELETLLSQIHMPERPVPPARRLGALATEMRELLTNLLSHKKAH
jgi:hypothetical protein